MMSQPRWVSPRVEYLSYPVRGIFRGAVLSINAAGHKTATLLSRGQDSERRDNLANDSSAPRRRKALLMIAVRGQLP
jgi:hypothetical protein